MFDCDRSRTASVQYPTHVNLKYLVSSDPESIMAEMSAGGGRSHFLSITIFGVSLMS